MKATIERLEAIISNKTITEKDENRTCTLFLHIYNVNKQYTPQAIFKKWFFEEAEAGYEFKKKLKGKPVLGIRNTFARKKKCVQAMLHFVTTHPVSKH